MLVVNPREDTAVIINYTNNKTVHSLNRVHVGLAEFCAIPRKAHG